MKYWNRTARKQLFASLSISVALGCSSTDRPRPSFNQRITPPSDAAAALPDSGEVKQVKDEVLASVAAVPAPSPVDSAPGVADSRSAAGPLSLTEAISLAYKLQPRLRVFHEGVKQAQGAEKVAVAPFLPMVAAGYSAGGFNLNAGGAPVPFGPGTPNFTFLPLSGTIPVGLNLSTGYELAELQVQWLLADFGRRMGRYQQAELGVDVAQLQTDRAYETVANEVAIAYYQVLRAQSLKKIAEEAVRRAEDDLDVAKKLEKGGVIEREKVLRSEVLVAQAKRGLDAADAAGSVSVAALNLAIGLNVNTATEVLPAPDLPAFRLNLADCLGEAVNHRRELQVAQLSIQSAQLGRQVAKAEFRPKVVGGGALVDLQQVDPRAHADFAVGFIKLEWGLFEGGRRVGEMRIADSKMRAAVAQAESMADTIAYQVTETYRQLFVAAWGIDRAKPAVEQATEAYRLLKARAARGDATPAEVTEAETALTRAEQDYQNSTYDYLTALARMNFAIGLPQFAASPAKP